MKEQHSWLHINAVTFVTQVPFTSVQIPNHAPCLLSQKENLLQCLDNLVKTNTTAPTHLKSGASCTQENPRQISVQIKLWFSRDITQHPKESISQQHFHAHAVSLYKMPNHRITINGKFQIWEHTANTQKKKTEQTECIPVHTCTITSGTTTSWNKYQYFLWWSQPPAKNSLQEPTCSKRSWCAYQSDKHPIRQGLLLKSITSS